MQERSSHLGEIGLFGLEEVKLLKWTNLVQEGSSHLGEIGLFGLEEG